MVFTNDELNEICEYVFIKNKSEALNGDDIVQIKKALMDFNDESDDFKVTEISDTMARYYFCGDIREVYIIHPDGTESLVGDIIAIQIKSTDDVFAIED
jgi:hypothetical protein